MIDRIKKLFCNHDFYLYEFTIGSDIMIQPFLNYYNKCKKCAFLDTSQRFSQWNYKFYEYYKQQGGNK